MKGITLTAAMPIKRNSGVEHQIESIPLIVFTLNVLNYEKRCRKNHAGKTLETISLEGGLSLDEALAILVDVDLSETNGMPLTVCNAVLKRIVRDVHDSLSGKMINDSLLERVNKLEHRAAHIGNTLKPIRNAPIGPNLMVFSSPTQSLCQRIRRTENGWLYQQYNGEWAEGLPSWECGGVYYMLYPELE